MENNVASINGNPTVVVDPMQSYINQVETRREALKRQLDAKIPRDVISARDGGGGRKLSYLEGHYVIARANEIFGQGNWQYQVIELTKTSDLPIETRSGVKQYTSYIAKVQVHALGVAFSDYGFGDGTDANPGKTHELAVKEAVTDGVKRALKNFGMSMGLALYDKSQENVDDGESEKQSKIGAGDSSGVGEQRAEASKAFVKPTTPATPVNGADASGTGQSAAPVSAKAGTRDEVNSLINATARVTIALKLFASGAAVKEEKNRRYGKTETGDLTDDQAQDFLVYLETMVAQVNKPKETK